MTGTHRIAMRTPHPCPATNPPYIFRAQEGKHAMWSAFIRQFAAYALTRRGKKLFALLGALLLCFATALLIDMQLTMSASLTGALTLAAAGAFVAQHFKLKRRLRERQQRLADDAIRRAARAKARGEKIGRSKAAFSGAYRNAARAVSETITGTARFFADAFAEMAQEVSDAYGDVKQTVGGAADGAAQAASSGAASLMQAGRAALAKAVALFARANEARAEPGALSERRLAGPHAVPRIGLRPDLN
jgi:hypothetical protein